MTTIQQTREITRMLLARVADDFNAAVQRIADAAVRDGEAPAGARLDLTASPIVWRIDVPDIQPPAAPPEAS